MSRRHAYQLIQDYFHEAQPMMRQLPWALYSWIAETVQQNEEDFGAIHPVVPNQASNISARRMILIKGSSLILSKV
jgi:hypothetical protein